MTSGANSSTWPQQDRRRVDGVGERVLPRPGRLQRLAVDDHLVGVVAEAPELERVGVGGAEGRVHQRPPLLRVRPLGEAWTSPVVRFEERGIAGIDDQDAHWRRRRGYLHSPS